MTGCGTCAAPIMLPPAIILRAHCRGVFSGACCRREDGISVRGAHGRSCSLLQQLGGSLCPGLLMLYMAARRCGRERVARQTASVSGGEVPDGKDFDSAKDTGSQNGRRAMCRAVYDRHSSRPGQIVMALAARLNDGLVHAARRLYGQDVPIEGVRRL